MCMHTVHNEADKQAAIKKKTGPGGWITIWKTVTYNNQPLYRKSSGVHFRKGLNVDPHVGESEFFLHYPTGFHCWATRKMAREQDNVGTWKVIKVRIRPSWVSSVGTQFWGGERGVVFVVDRFYTDLKRQR